MASLPYQSHQILDLFHDDVETINPNPSKKLRRSPTEVTQIELCLSPDAFLCEICVEPKPSNEFFNVKGCSHSYCSDCMVKYVASNIQENVVTIKCPEPDCQGVLEPEFCRSILPSEVFDRWCSALCESVIPASQKFYCPYKDCSALLVNDGEKVVRESKCPHCQRLFCVQCKVPWHSGMGCQEFQKSNENDRQEELMLMRIAKRRKWQRCPNCKFFVQRNKGCSHISCRCGIGFCYTCGAQMEGHHECYQYNLSGSSDNSETEGERSNMKRCSKCGIPGHNKRTCRNFPHVAQTEGGVTMGNQGNLASFSAQVEANSNAMRLRMAQGAYYQTFMQTVSYNGSLRQSSVGPSVRPTLPFQIPSPSPTTVRDRLQQLRRLYAARTSLRREQPPVVNLTTAQQPPVWIGQYVRPQAQMLIPPPLPQLYVTQEALEQQSRIFLFPSRLYPYQHTPSMDPITPLQQPPFAGHTVTPSQPN